MKSERSALFISDLHLSESRSDIVTAFYFFLEKIAPKADALYILGDLFDFWAGDDIRTPITEGVAERLISLKRLGVELYFQHGNRDFALGKRYAKEAGLRIIPPFYMPEAYPNLLLLHGDELCSDDRAYQRYKRVIRNPLILALLRTLPKSYRLKLAARIRHKSQMRGGNKIVDVNELSVRRHFERKKRAIMIHGHTHRAAMHYYPYGCRYVLSDWDEYGDYLYYKKGRIERKTFKIKSIHEENL